MRGKVFRVLLHAVCIWITPAYAGKSSDVFQKIPLYKDHPRLCGEKRMAASKLLTDTGSPPPMRGKAISDYLSDFGTGITPAYAGKSFSLRRRGCEMWDHPRLCGEKQLSANGVNEMAGSPPPMRGKADLSQLFNGFLRITPAYAGKSCFYANTAVSR